MKWTKPLATALLVLLFGSAAAYAVMPPRTYAERSEKAKIKAIAVIEKVVDMNDRPGHKMVYFKREYALTKETPENFKGHCTSAVTQKQKTLVGGGVYFYPNEGERVFVTIDTFLPDSGIITSLTPMTPELEKVIRENPEKLRYGIVSVFKE